MSTASTVTEGRKMLRQRMPGIMQRLITLPGMRAAAADRRIISALSTCRTADFFAAAQARTIRDRIVRARPRRNTACSASRQCIYVPSSAGPQARKTVLTPAASRAERTVCAADNPAVMRLFLFFMISLS